MLNRYRTILEKVAKTKSVDLKLKAGNDTEDANTKRKMKASKKTNTVTINPDYDGMYTGSL